LISCTQPNKLQHNTYRCNAGQHAKHVGKNEQRPHYGKSAYETVYTLLLSTRRSVCVCVSIESMPRQTDRRNNCTQEGTIVAITARLRHIFSTHVR